MQTLDLFYFLINSNIFINFGLFSQFGEFLLVTLAHQLKILSLCLFQGKKSCCFVKFFGDNHRRRRRTFESVQQFGGQRPMDRQRDFRLARKTVQSQRGDFLPKSQRRRFSGTVNWTQNVAMGIEYLMILYFSLSGKCAEKEVFQRCARSQEKSQNSFTTHFYLLGWRTL